MTQPDVMRSNKVLSFFFATNYQEVNEQFQEGKSEILVFKTTGPDIVS